MAMNIRQLADGAMAIVGDNATDQGAQVANFYPGNKVLGVVAGTIARADTAAKTLGTIPPGGIPVGVRWFGGVNSDAGTTAKISVGYTTGTEFINAVSVAASSTSQTFPASGANLGASISDTDPTTITGLYAETGTASTTGGPWTVIVEYYMGV